MSEREEMNEERAPRRGRKPSREESGRNKRIPLGVPALKMSIPSGLVPDGYVPRWIKGDPGRLQRAEQAGYEFVTDPTAEVGEGSDNGNSGHGSRVSRLVGKNPDGQPRFDYLMMIRQEWYDEDQVTKQKTIDEVDEVIRRGHFNEKAGDERYVPKEGIRIR